MSLFMKAWLFFSLVSLFQMCDKNYKNNEKALYLRHDNDREIQPIPGIS